MPKSLQDNQYFIKFYLETPSICQRKSVLKELTKSQFITLSEISLNLISGHLITLTKPNIDKLKKHKLFLEKLAGKKAISKKILVSKHKAIYLMLSIFKPYLKQFLT